MHVMHDINLADMAPDDTLSTAQVARVLHISSAYASRLCREGIIPASVPGKRSYRVKVRDLRAYIEASKVAPAVGVGQ